MIRVDYQPLFQLQGRRKSRRRRTAKITSDFLVFPCNHKSYKNRKMYPTIHQYSSQIQIYKPTVHGQLNDKNKYKKTRIAMSCKGSLGNFQRAPFYMGDSSPSPPPPNLGIGGGGRRCNQCKVREPRKGFSLL